MILRRSVARANLAGARQTATRLVGGVGGFGFEYSARDFAVVVLEGDAVDRRHVPRDGGLEPFEVRYFSRGCEVRWTRDGDSGDVVVLIDDAHPAFSTVQGDDIDVVETIEQRYVCWGEVDTTEGRWAMLGDARVGSYSLPVTPASGRVRLVTVEYVTVGVDGNAEIAAECAVGFVSEES